MALLRAEVGPLSSEKTATNAKAGRVFKACALRWGYAGDPTDNQAVLDFFVAGLVSRIVDQAKAQDRDSRVRVALDEAAADEPELTA